MKILIVTQYFFPENFKINDVAVSLINLGHEVEVLTGIPNYPAGKYYNGYTFYSQNDNYYKGIKVHRAKIIPRGNGGKIMISLNYLSFVVFGFLKLIRINRKFDKILTFAPSPITVGLLGIIASKKFSSKSLLWVQDLWPESVKVAGGIGNPLIIKILDYLTRFIYKNTDKILIQSEYFKEYLIHQKVNSKKIYYLPNYAEDFYKIVPNNDNIKDKYGNSFSIVFAGNFGKAQNLKTLVEAATVLKKERVNVSFIMIGDGRERENIKSYIKKLNVKSFFKFLGYVEPEEMPMYFASADSLFLSLRKIKIFSLTIPSKLQSYMACGRPIIGSIDGVTAKIIQNSNSGFVSEPDDSTMLAQTIKKMINLSDKERLKMGDNALKYYNNNFNKEMVINNLINMLNE